MGYAYWVKRSVPQLCEVLGIPAVWPGRVKDHLGELLRAIRP